MGKKHCSQDWLFQAAMRLMSASILRMDISIMKTLGLTALEGTSTPTPDAQLLPWTPGSPHELETRGLMTAEGSRMLSSAICLKPQILRVTSGDLSEKSLSRGAGNSVHPG